ncbi:WhiB family transcriptional regulator [Streptomyces sp. WAC01280]|uniref:WhiB family transcriptional regulator n=1 Tax=Streptomyces sp. WAC01280 TaxID=2487424 RepID=UPI00163BC8F8|nr:WhiB family transcriptional regulator [Streptomyces sp. WAC01280]
MKAKITALDAKPELLVRVRRIRRTLRADNIVGSPACAAVDPEEFHPDAPSGLSTPPFKAERRAMAYCQGCPLVDLCLLQELREAPSVAHVLGVRAGLRQADRQALYLAVKKEGLL